MAAVAGSGCCVAYEYKAIDELFQETWERVSRHCHWEQAASAWSLPAKLSAKPRTARPMFATKLPLAGRCGRRRSCSHSGLNDRYADMTGSYSAPVKTRSLQSLKLAEQPSGLCRGKHKCNWLEMRLAADIRLEYSRTARLPCLCAPGGILWCGRTRRACSLHGAQLELQSSHAGSWRVQGAGKVPHAVEELQRPPVTGSPALGLKVAAEPPATTVAAWLGVVGFSAARQPVADKPVG